MLQRMPISQVFSFNCPLSFLFLSFLSSLVLLPTLSPFIPIELRLAVFSGKGKILPGKSSRLIAFEQALRGALAAEKERELATTSLEFEYLHRKSRCEMLIGRDATCFSMFVYIRARFRFALIGENLTAQSTGSHRGIGGGIQIRET